MPRLTSKHPSYRHHKASDQAIVTISGKDHYLGPWNTKASRGEEANGVLLVNRFKFLGRRLGLPSVFGRAFEEWRLANLTS